MRWGGRALAGLLLAALGWPSAAQTPAPDPSFADAFYLATSGDLLEQRLRDYRVISRGDRRERVREEELEGGERLRTREVSRSDGVTASERADGTVVTSREGPDPAWGSRGPAPQRREIRTPSGLTRSVTVERGATLTDADDPLSVESRTSTVTLDGRTFERLYDGATRRTTWTTPEGRSVVTVIDALGRVVESRTGNLAPLAVSYDAAGRLAALTQGTGSEARTVTFGYNAAGRLAQVTDPLSRSASFTYDALGRVTAQTLADGRALGFSSDANGNLTALAPPERPAHGFAYTPVDLQEEYAPPAVGAGDHRTRFVHDLDRRLSRIERPDGSAVELAYDAAGRLTFIDAPEGVTGIAYRPGTRDPAVLTAPDGSTLTYTYDGFLLTGATWSGEVAGSVERTYDADFRVAERTVNGGHPVAFAYDRDGLLVNAGNLTLHRDPANGLVTGTTLGQVTTETGYNAFGEPVAESAVFAGSPLLEMAYTRDALGRITGKTETVGGVTDTYAYTYDLAGRLTEVEKNGLLFAQYTYDANGNRLSYDGTFGRFTGTYDAQDRLLTYGEALDSTVYTYTASGELSGKSAGGQTVTYDYGALGDLLRVTLDSGVRIDYLVDARNRRIGKKIDGTRVQGFLYKDRLNPVAELDGAGNVTARFVYGTRANVPDSMVKGGTTYRLLSDPLGSVRLVVDVTTGTVAQRLDYDEYGRVILDTHPGFQPFAFAGGLYDPQTGLTRFGARDYDPEVGRWTAKDPVLFRGRSSNLYAYAYQDPINFLDPNGQSAFVGALPAAGGAVAADGPLPVGDVVAGGILIVAGVYDLWTFFAEEPEELEPTEPEPAPEPGDPETACPKPPTSPPPYPSSPDTPPGPDWDWKGPEDKGQWHREETRESLRPDLDHPGHGDHYDWIDPAGNKWRYYPDGRLEPKK